MAKATATATAALRLSIRRTNTSAQGVDVNQNLASDVEQEKCRCFREFEMGDCRWALHCFGSCVCRDQPQKAKSMEPPGRQVCAGQTRNRALQLDRAGLHAGHPDAKEPEGCVRVVRRCCRVLG